ncbi:MAG: DUF481 domain-containing protein [Bacteroidota bacterium]
MKQILYCLLFFPFFLSAQINESDTINLQAGLSITGTFQGGNVDTWIFRAKQDLSVKTLRKWVFKTQNSYVYQEFGKEKADEDFLSLNFLYFNPDRKLYPQLLGFVSTNFRREIDLRYLFGAGFTYQLIQHKKDWLKFSLTAEYEQTDFFRANFNRTEYNGSEFIKTFRTTLWINGKYHLFKSKMILSHESFFQPSLEQDDNFRWQSDIGLSLPISKFFSFKVDYRRTFESIVIEGQKREDQFLTFGFTVKNY